MNKTNKLKLSIYGFMMILTTICCLCFIVPASNTLNNSDILESTYTSGNFKYTYTSGSGVCSVAKSSTSISGSITIPSTVSINSATYKVTSVASSGFYGCNSITSVSFSGSNMATISYGAFSSCTKLTSITIPSSVTSLTSDFVDGCTALTTINVNTSNTTYSASSGVLYNKSKTELMKYPEGKTGTSFTVPSTVVELDNHAFRNCTKLTSLAISSTITYMGSGVFEGCTGLQYTSGDLIYIKTTTNSYYYLLDTTSTTISSVSINANCKFIGTDACRDCKSITSVTIPEGVTYISSFAFYNCTGLTSVTIPSTVKHIDYNAFDACNNLTNVTINNSGSIYIGSGTFGGTATGYPGKLSLGDTTLYSLNYGTRSGINGTYTSITIVTKPTLSFSTVEYDGTSKSPLSGFDDNTMTKSGVDTATNVGSYTITISLSDTTQYVWSDNTTTSFTLSWSITPKYLTIPTIANTTITYNGQTQNAPTITGYYSSTMNKTGATTGVSAATYTITISLKDTTNYRWSNGTTSNKALTWVISSKSLTSDGNMAITPDNGTYNGDGYSPQ